MYLLYEIIIHFLRTLLFWSSPVKSRISFENKNKTDPGSLSFRLNKTQADLAFEFSSEGEFQQIASLVEDALLEGKKIELIFFSPSVEKTVMDLGQKFPHQVRYLRYPLVTLGFRGWITSTNLILVRYDLFPEFLFWAQDPKHALKMVWVSFKKERITGKRISVFKKMFLKKMKYLVFASKADQDFASEFGLSGIVYDFRMEQIHRRILNRQQKFQERFPLYADFKNNLEKIPRSRRLILGNAWPEDLELLKGLPQDVQLVVVPHQLKPDILASFRLTLKNLGREVVEISDETTELVPSMTYLINKKGILCELYADFAKAYVGGGLGVSVHSILEPLVAGSEQICCGPIHHRSSEFDVAHELGRVSEVSHSRQFQDWLSEPVPKNAGHDKLELIFNRYAESRKEVISC